MSLKSAGRIKASEKTNASPSSAGHVCRMNISFRHVIFCACALLLLLSLFAGSAAAVSGTTGDLTWDLTNGTLTISGTGAMPNYSPNGAPWFSYCSSITNVVIESGVTSIGGDAFFNCSSLTSIVLPDGVTSIGSYAFSDCSSLTSIDLPDGVTSIGSYAFLNCSSLTSIDLPDSVTSIGEGVFYNCSSLTSINVADENTKYKDIDGVLFSKDGTLLHTYPAGKTAASYAIPDSLTTIGYYAFCWCSSLTSVDLPDSLTSIGSSAFEYCSSLTSIDLPEGVTTIGYYAFFYCSSLTSIDLPDSVTSIGEGAFCYCSSLTSINVADENTKYKDIDGVLFSKDGTLLHTYPAGKTAASYAIPDSVTSIGNYAFSSCNSLTSVDLPDSLTTIGYAAFEYCSSLTSIDLPEGVTTIGVWAFYNCRSLTSIDLPESVTNIGNRAFYYCSSLTSIDLPDSVTSIGDWAFYGLAPNSIIYCTESTAALLSGNYSTNLTALAVTNGDSSYTFTSAVPSLALSEANAPSGITYGGWFKDAAFTQQVTSIAAGTNPTLWVKEGCPSAVIASGMTGDLTWMFSTDGTLTISGTGAMPNYPHYDEAPWYSYSNSITSVVIKSGLTSIGSYAFCECSSLTSVDLPAGLTTIGYAAFSDCSSLSSIDLPAGVTIIGDWAFSDCSSLTSADLPNSVTSIGYGAFAECSSLTSINVADENTKYKDIDGVLFSKDGTLLHTYPAGKTVASYAIPDGVTSIGDEAFRGCSRLTSITLPTGVTSIGDGVFSGCSSLTSVDLPDSLTSIGDWAFSDCSSLTSVDLPDSVTSIGDCVFAYCRSLTSVDLPTGVKSVGIWAFDYLASNSIIYCVESTAALLSGNYYTDRTAIAVKNTDGSYTFTSAVTALTLSEANAPSGITYGGWFKDAAFMQPVTSIAAGTNPTLWLKSGSVPVETFTVTYNANDADSGSVPVDSTAYTAGTSVTVLGNTGGLAQTGYIFSGWNTKADGSGTTYAAGDTFTITADTTLYAKWTAEAPYSLCLKAGWNFISVPKHLDTAYDTAAELFGGIDTASRSILIYDGASQSWATLKAGDLILPLEAYWIYSAEPANIPLDWIKTPVSPEMKNIYAGWNAVGISADTPAPANAAFANINWVNALPWDIDGQEYGTALIRGITTGEYAETNTIPLYAGVWLYANENGIMPALTA